MANNIAVLTGDTFQVREKLKGAGWKWDAERKAWTKSGEWQDESDVIRDVRMIGGIRNRGTFSATIEQ